MRKGSECEDVGGLARVSDILVAPPLCNGGWVRGRCEWKRCCGIRAFYRPRF